MTIGGCKPKRKVTYQEGNGKLKVYLPRSETKVRPFRNTKPYVRMHQYPNQCCFICKRFGHLTSDCWKSKPVATTNAESSAKKPTPTPKSSKFVHTHSTVAAPEPVQSEMDPDANHWTLNLAKRQKRMLLKKAKAQRTKVENAERADKRDWN